MDSWLIILIIIFSVVIVLVNSYLMIIYIHPDDKGVGNSVYYKILVVLGMSVCFGLVLMMPLDVSNARHNGGLNMKDFWLAMYVIVFIMIVFLLPFGIFLYESDPDRNIAARICGALLYECIVVIVSLALLFISFAFCNTAHIPITTINKDITQFQTGSIISTNADQQNIQLIRTMQMKVSFPIYLMSCTAWLGFWVFVIFGGFGLTALPLDLIYAFINRPKQLSSAEAARKKVQLRNINSQLIQQGQELKEDQKEAQIIQGFLKKRKAKAQYNNRLKEYKGAVLQAEQEVEIFKLELDIHNTQPVLYVLGLLLGVVLVVISLFWWLHIILYSLTSTHNFFNNILTGLENANVMFLSVFIILALSFYMLVVTIKGTFKLGLRIPYILSFHVMQPNETLMNAFMFNIILILISTTAITMFLTGAFHEFARFSQIQLIFGSQVKNLTFFKTFYQNKIFEYILVIWTPLAMILQLVMPRKDNKHHTDIQDIRKGKSKANQAYL